MDQSWRDSERRYQANPGDQEALHRAIFARRRAGVPVPGWMLDEREFPAERFESALPLTVSVLLPDGRPVTVGRTPGVVELPPRRMTWVQPESDDFDAVIDEILSQGVPGLSLDTSAKDADLAQVAHLTHLNRLDLSGCAALTSLDPLAHLGELTTLRLWQCRGLKNAALGALQGCGALTTLDLSGCRDLGSTALAHLSALDDLRALTCAGLRTLTDDGLQSLAGLQRLTSLDLRRCEGLTGAGIAHLPALRELTVLNLSFCTRLTAQALEPLLELEHVSVLYLLGTGIPEGAARAVLRPLERCDVRL